MRVSRYLLLLLLSISQSACAVDPLPRLNLPPGFQIDYFAENIDDARSMALGERGTLFVGSRKAGKVHALVDEDADGRADRRYLIAQGLRMPNGVDFRDGALYLAENHRILRFDRIEEQLDKPPKPVVIANLPDSPHHGWRYMRFGPDGYLYFAVGAPCNVCNEAGFAVIERMRPDGSEREVYAEGIRNSVGFDWDPASGDLWFTDNGRDWLGDDLPPDELNHAAAEGLHFGFPFCHAGEIADPEFGDQKRCAEFVPPAQKLGPHVAALGMRFYTGQQFPAAYKNQILLAEHGSWNRSTPIGYRVALVRLEAGRAIGYETFIDGWLGDDGSVAGRPVDLMVMPDGALLISDDKAGAIYRVSYRH
jgi:glucose/arabinose dehydrogenase